MKLFLEIFGWYGAVAILGAYALVSFSILEPNNVWYQLLNVTGGVGIVLISSYKQAYQPAALNIIWSLIGLIAIVQILLN